MLLRQFPEHFARDLARTIGVLASGPRTAAAMESLINSTPDSILSIALLPNGSEQLSDRTPEIILRELAFPGGWPANLWVVSHELSFSRSFLTDIGEVILYYDDGEPYDRLGTAANACAFQAMLALSEGVSVECRDIKNRRCPWPFEGSRGKTLRKQLYHWHETQYAYTADITRGGLTIGFDGYRSLLNHLDGEPIFVSDLAVSIALVHRVVTLEQWYRHLWRRNAFGASAAKIGNRELDLLAAELRSELGPDLTIKIEYAE